MMRKQFRLLQYNYIFYLSIISGYLIMPSCKQQQTTAVNSDQVANEINTEEVREENPVEEVIPPKINTAYATSQVKELLNNKEIWGVEKVNRSPFLSQIYEESENGFLWEPSSWEVALNTLGEAKFDGFKLSNYQVDLIGDIIILPESTDSTLTKKAAQLDVFLTNAYLNYGQDLVEGMVDPKALFPEWNYRVRTFSEHEVNSLKESAIKGDPMLFINRCRPQNDRYHVLVEWLRDSYESGNDISENLQFSDVNAAIHPGDSTPLVRELKLKLRQFGAFSGHEPSMIFDDSLKNALVKFQKHRGLESDGVVGKKTFEALNFSLQEMQGKVRANLERGRWLLHDLPTKFLLVNVAGYELYIFHNEIPEYRSNVIVGQDIHQTPVFHSDIKYVEFNCTWTVPYSIASKELLPNIKKNSNYLSSRHFEVLSNGKVVDASTIDFSQYNERNFPYQLRQKPGPYNALGTMKFIFPNPYSVYLHDTPARYLFEKEGGRAFSHGCVRVHHPERLAEQLLKPNNVNQKDIQKILEAKETKQVFLKKSMQVLITYWTVFRKEDSDILYFVPDIYGRDRKLLNALNAM